MALLAAISAASALAQRQDKILPSGVNVDDFYLVAHGNDDAISIRLAIAHALANNISKVSFSNKTYYLRSAITESYYFYARSVISVHCTEWMDNLELEGNGAILFVPGRASADDYQPIFRVRAAIRNLKIHGFHFKRDLLLYSYETYYANLTGITMHAMFGKEDMDSVVIDSCIFEDCHRAINVDGGVWPSSEIAAIGKLKSFVVTNCRFLYPRGANNALPPGGAYYGGSQGFLIQPWARNFWMCSCFFDGATTGTIEGNGGAPAKDGLIIGGGIHTIVVASTFRHFSVEGLFIIKPFYIMGGSYPGIPAPGGEFVITLYDGEYNPAGLQVGDRLRFLAPAEPLAYTHEVEILAVNMTYGQIYNKTLDVRSIWGPADANPGTRQINHEVLFNEVFSAWALDNVFDEVSMTEGVNEYLGYDAIEFFNVENCIAIGNTVRKTSWCIVYRYNKNVLVRDNFLYPTQWGVAHFSHVDPDCHAIIADNFIELQNKDQWGLTWDMSGIVIASGFSEIYGNQISHHPSKTMAETGISFGQSIKDSRIHNNTFTNLAVDIGADQHYTFIAPYDNTHVNVASIQTFYPRVFADDAAAAAGPYPPGPAPIGAVYALPNGTLRNRQT